MESQQRDVAKLTTHILDALFPEHCVQCETEGSVLCSRCRVNWTPSPAYEQGIFSMGVYREPTLRTLLQLWKYQGVRGGKVAIMHFLSRTMREYRSVLPSIDVVTSVPLHARKKNERGFDQAEEIALHLAHHLQISYVASLRRIKDTESQAQIERDKRDESDFVQSFLATPDARELSGKRVLIVDDVYTTGTTMAAAAQALSVVSPKEIVGFVLARG